MSKHEQGLKDILELVLTDLDTLSRDDVGEFRKDWLAHIYDNEHVALIIQLAVNMKAYKIINAIVLSNSVIIDDIEEWLDHAENNEQWEVSNLDFHPSMEDKTAVLCAILKSELTGIPLIKVMTTFPAATRHHLLKYIVA